ncbi:MAG: DUF5819 family protein [Cyclobacteriaceae bacterium]
MKTPVPIVNRYINPLFTQSWSMFSKPPTTNRIVYFQFRHRNDTDSTVTTSWYDMNKPLNRYNEKHIFTVAQRLLKYRSASLNNIFQIVDRFDCNIEGTTITDLSCISYSAGFHSLRNYAAFFYNKQFGQEAYENVEFRIKISDEVFPRMGEEESTYGAKNHYKELNIPYTPLFVK